MNLDQNPTKEELKELVSAQDDKAGHHMLWVSVDGDVFLDTVPSDLTPLGYCESLEEKMQFRLETFHADNDYTGPTAAKDKEWIDRLYTALVTNWESDTMGYIDVF